MNNNNKIVLCRHWKRRSTGHGRLWIGCRFAHRSMHWTRQRLHRFGLCHLKTMRSHHERYVDRYIGTWWTGMMALNKLKKLVLATDIFLVVRWIFGRSLCCLRYAAEHDCHTDSSDSCGQTAAASRRHFMAFVVAASHRHCQHPETDQRSRRKVCSSRKV